MKQVTLNVSDEWGGLGDSLATIIGDIKAKKSVSQMLTDSMPSLMTALGGMANMGTDLGVVDNQVYIVYAIAKAAEAPAPAPVAAAPAPPVKPAA